MRSALHSAGTSVWSWHLPSDHIEGFADGAALLGYEPADLAHTQLAWNDVIHPDDLAANEAAFQRHARGEIDSYESEYRARAKEGNWLWISERGRIVEWDAEGMPCRMIGTLADISLRKQHQGNADELLDRLQQIARSAPGVLFQYRRWGDKGRFLYVSERIQELFGVSAQALMQNDQALARLTDPDDLKTLQREAATRFALAAPWRTEYRIHHPQAGQRWVRMNSTARIMPDGSTLWHGYMEDISEQRQLEQLREDAAAAQAANRAKTEFLSRMSHELRTPLNAVLGFSQLLEMDQAQPLEAEQRRRVGHIREAGKHLLDMIGELLDLTRIESGQLAVALEPLALLPLLNECVGMLRPQADARRIRLHLHASQAVAPVQADATRLKQVLLNLLSNAIKYNRSGGSVDVVLSADADAARIDVIDTGMGIAAADLQRLFEPFNRLSHSRSTIEGTGIGLAVTRQLVELMGGRVEVSSIEGRGSTFSVHLPRHQPTSRAEAP